MKYFNIIFVIANNFKKIVKNLKSENDFCYNFFNCITPSAV